MVNNPNIRFAGFADDWVQRKLGDVVEKQIKGKAQFEKLAPGDVEYLDTSRLNGGQAILTDGLKDVTLDDILILWDGSKAGTVYHEFEGALGSTLKAYRTSANSKFVYQYLKRHQDNIYNHYRTPNIPHVQKDFLNVFMINVPNTDEQQKIGSVFSTLDHKIGLEERQIALLKDLKKGYLQKMFPKNGATVPELRFAGFADDWEERKLGDYIIQYSEKTKQNNQYPIFTSSRNGLFFQKDYYKGNQIASEDNTGYNIVPRGYFTYRHMSDDLVFKFNINDLADYGIVSTLYPVFTTNEQLDSKYLQYQLNEGSEFRRFSLLQKQGGSRTYMYLNKLQNMILTIPSIEEQQQIGSFFKQLDDTIARHQCKLDLLKDLKKGLSQQMFV